MTTKTVGVKVGVPVGRAAVSDEEDTADAVGTAVDVGGNGVKVAVAAWGVKVDVGGWETEVDV